MTTSTQNDASNDSRVVAGTEPVLPVSGQPKRRGNVSRVVVWCMVVLIRWYQVVISPLTPAACRFTPTCSAYAIEVIRRDGPLRGTWKALRRVGRCHPFHPGGYDPP
ncbi:MAG: membrane protein insertion efficiency factor YidD [Planctomycetota bacterium]